MTLEQLRIFLAVAERQHVTRAAHALNLTQSAVSAAIAALEARHGLHLFDRIGRRIVLTDAGHTFMAEARAVLERAETAARVLDDLAREPRGRLHIHASQTVASYWLPARLVALHDRHPGIDLRLSVGNTAQVAAAVEQGTADLGLVEGAVAQGDLRRQVVARDRLVLVMAAGHAPAAAAMRGARMPKTETPGSKAPGSRAPGPEMPDLDWMRAQVWILREPGSGTRAAFETWLERAGGAITALNVALDLPSNEAVLSAVAGSRCVSVLSHRAAESAVAAGWIRALPLAGAERPFSLLSNPQHHRTRAMQALIDILPENP